MNRTDLVFIDDDDGILWLLEEICLDKYSFKISQTGVTGLQCIEKYQPRLAIIDFRLGGGMNGLDVAKKVPEKCNKTGIIFLTGYSKAVIENLDKSLPVLKVIEKPFDVTEFMDIIGGFLRGDMSKSM